MLDDTNPDLFHSPVVGEDGIERCQWCNQTMQKKGRVTPRSTPCPSLDPSIDSRRMATTPLNAFLIDIEATQRRDEQTTERIESQISGYRLPVNISGALDGWL